MNCVSQKKIIPFHFKVSGYNLTDRVKNYINEDIDKRRTRKLDFLAALEIAGVVKDIEQKEQEGIELHD